MPLNLHIYILPLSITSPLLGLFWKVWKAKSSSLLPLIQVLEKITKSEASISKMFFSSKFLSSRCKGCVCYVAFLYVINSSFGKAQSYFRYLYSMWIAIDYSGIRLVPRYLLQSLESIFFILYIIVSAAGEMDIGSQCDIREICSGLFHSLTLGKGVEIFPALSYELDSKTYIEKKRHCYSLRK